MHLKILICELSFHIRLITASGGTLNDPKNGSKREKSLSTQQQQQQQQEYWSAPYCVLDLCSLIHSTHKTYVVVVVVVVVDVVVIVVVVVVI